MKTSSLLTVLSLAVSAWASLPPINVTGNAFWNTETGERFYIRGLDYQPGGSSDLTDPLADSSICERDIPYFKELGVNTIRVYTIDNTKDHSECMNALADAGIYLVLDVNTPDASLSRADVECSYNAAYLQSVFATIDAMVDFDNVLGFFAANEVINDEETTGTATYVKAVVRDMKNYMKARNYRNIPVGYSAADVSTNRQQVAQYLNCGDDDTAKIDMFGVNDYSWCGDSSFTTSGYSEKVEMYSGYSKPIFLSEFGCNTASTRPFTEIEAIYSEKMTVVFSGGLVYEYSQEANDYGLVEIDGDEVTKLDSFTALAKQFNATANPTGDGDASTSNEDSECPDFEAGTWEANNTLPEMPSAASIYFSSGAGEPQGTGYGTQWKCGEDDASYIAYTATHSADSSEETGDSSSSSSSSSTASSTGSESSSSSNAVAIGVPTGYKLVGNILGRLSINVVLGLLAISFAAVVV